MANWATQVAAHWKRRADVANVFGVILYTDAHANIKKVLQDPEYWRALDEKSGSLWPIFSIRPTPGRTEHPRFPRAVVGMMVPVWKEPQANRELLSDFGLDSTEHIPALVVFCLTEDEQVLSRVLRLSDASIDAAYNSLMEAVGLATRAVEAIALENRKDDIGAFGAINLAVQHREDWKKLKSGLGLFNTIRGILAP